MRLLVLFTIFASLIGSSHSEEKNLNLAETLTQVRENHSKLESYYAVYEGTAPGGKSINAVIVHHKKGKLAAVQAQFLVNGKIVAAPLQVSTPNLGLVLGGSHLVNLHDTHDVLGKLSSVLAILYGEPKFSLGDWAPALSLSKETAAAQLTLTADAQVPWLRGTFPKETTVTQLENHLSFQTPDQALYQVQSQTGILQRQTYTNQGHERTLILKSLETNLSEEEISAFIDKIIPPDISVKSIREHALLIQLQLSSLQQIINSIESQTLTLTQVKERLAKSDSAIKRYLLTIYPDAANQIAGPDKWKEAIQTLSTKEQSGLAKELAHVVRNGWKTPLLLDQTTLLSREEDGKKAANLLIEKFNTIFLSLAIEQALQLHSEG